MIAFHIFTPRRHPVNLMHLMKFDNNDFQTAVRLTLMKHKKPRESENVTIVLMYNQQLYNIQLCFYRSETMVYIYNNFNFELALQTFFL